LRQIPTLLLDDGEAIFDSRVICSYLASLAPGSSLIPNDFRVHTRWSMIVGLMDASVARQMERIRPLGEQSPGAIALYERRIARTISRLEAEAAELCAPFARIDRLAAAVALDYIDFRYPHDWRAAAPTIARWLPTENERPAMVATRPS
jgi:glutathione S-transferase